MPGVLRCCDGSAYVSDLLHRRKRGSSRERVRNTDIQRLRVGFALYAWSGRSWYHRAAFGEEPRGFSFNREEEWDMKKFLAILVASTFAAGTAFAAQHMKGDAMKKDEMKKDAKKDGGKKAAAKKGAAKKGEAKKGEMKKDEKK